MADRGRQPWRAAFRDAPAIASVEDMYQEVDDQCQKERHDHGDEKAPGRTPIEAHPASTYVAPPKHGAIYLSSRTSTKVTASAEVRSHSQKAAVRLRRLRPGVRRFTVDKSIPRAGRNHSR